MNEMSNRPRVKVAKIKRVIVERYGLTLDAMTTPKRHRRVAYPRMIAMYLARQLTPNSLPALGRMFGGRDHTTVLHAVRRIKAKAESNALIERELNDIERRLLEDAA
jgi:chromosomal replication initiator protein